jgi:hypothetical protein
MHPYFQNLDRQLFTEEEKLSLVLFFSNNHGNFYQYKNNLGELDDNNVHYSISNLHLPPVARVLIELNIRPTAVVGLMHKPNIKLIRHKDEKDMRRTVIICPLSPAPGLYTPTHFYKLKEGCTRARDTEWAAACTFDNGVPAIVNTRQFHDLTNNDSYRYNLQFCFSQSFEEITGLYLEGRLFRDTNAKLC